MYDVFLQKVSCSWRNWDWPGYLVGVTTEEEEEIYGQ